VSRVPWPDARSGVLVSSQRPLPAGAAERARGAQSISRTAIATARAAGEMRFGLR
jgi:hypothetical protein